MIAELFSYLTVLTVCVTAMAMAFLVALSIPDAQLRHVTKHVVLAVACVFYILSPVDLLPAAVLGPLGSIDDLAALVAAVVAARKAWDDRDSDSGTPSATAAAA